MYFVIKRVLHVVIIPISILGLFTSLWGIVAVIGGIRRYFDPVDQLRILFSAVPLFFVSSISLFLLVKIWRISDKILPLFGTIPLIALMVSLSFYLMTIYPNFIDKSVVIRSDTTRPTEDGLFEYNFQLVNWQRRNGYARIFLRNLMTDEEIFIPIDVPVGDITGFSTPGIGGFIWARLEFDDTLNQYILNIPAGAGFTYVYINDVRFQHMTLNAIGNATFLIDVLSRTATRME